MSTITDEMVEAACREYWERYRADHKFASMLPPELDKPFAELGDKTRTLTRSCMRAALEAAEAAAWRPIEEAPMNIAILVRPQDPKFVPGYVATLKLLRDETVGGDCLFLEDGAGRRFIPQCQLFCPLPSPPKATS